VVDAATKRGIYSIVDWHSHHAPKHVADAQAFFDTVSTLYGNNPGVIFEIFNEPWDNDYTWPEIKAYAEAVIPVIRKHSSNLILVGTRQWSRDVDEASLDPIADPNLAYVLHFYAGSHRDTLRARGQTALDNGVALFVSEWGTTNEDGGTVDSVVYTGPSDDWFKWIDANKISTCNWSVQNKAEASAILTSGLNKNTGWDPDKDLTKSGKYVRALIRERNTQYTYERPPVDSSLLPGRIEAESYSAVSGLTISGPGDDDNSQYLGFSQEGSWAEYDTYLPQQRKGVIALRVGSGDPSAQVTVKVNGKTVKVVKFNGTGAWGKFATVVSDSFLVSAGVAKIRLEWNGLFDLNWFELTGCKDETPVYDTIHQSVRIEAENFVKKNGMTVESSGDVDNTMSLGYTYDTTWAEYKTLLPTGFQTLAVRGASASKGATLVFKVDGATKASVKFPGTNGWKTWATTVSDPFELASTDSVKVRVEWTQGDNSAGLVNLNWFEFRGPDLVRVPVLPGASRSRVSALATAAGLRVEFGTGFSGTVRVSDLRGRILSERSLSGVSSADFAMPRTNGLLVVRIQEGTRVRSIPVLRP
jgi:endoglucanase